MPTLESDSELLAPAPHDGPDADAEVDAEVDADAALLAPDAPAGAVQGDLTDGGASEGGSPDGLDAGLPAGDADGADGADGDPAPAEGGADPDGLVAADPAGADDAHEAPLGDAVEDAGGPAAEPAGTDVVADADAGPSPRRRRRAERLLARISALGVKLDDARAHLQGPGSSKAGRALDRLQLRCVRLAERVQESGGMGKDRGRLARAALSRISSAIDTFLARPSTRGRARALREAAREARKALPKRG